MKLLARDLRTGNLLQGKPVSITRLEMYSNGITAITAHGIDYIENGTMPENNYKPILITRDNLLACGYEHKKYGDTYIDRSSLEIKIYRPYRCSMDKPAKERVLLYVHGKCVPNDKIKYIHQLQNFYYLYTGIELIIDTSKLK